MDTGGLKVLMISSDRNILAPESAVQTRMKEYGALVAELHIVLLSDLSHNLKETQIAKNVWVYPTGALIKFLRPRAASVLAKKIIFEKNFVRGQSVVTTQDPFECGMVGAEVKERWRIPLEVQLHTDPFGPHFAGPLNKIRLGIAKDVLPKADGVRVVTESLKQKLVAEYKLNPDIVTVLPIYIDTERIEHSTSTFDLHDRFGWRFIFLMTARLTEEKNVGLALEALAQVRTEYPDTGIVIVGSGVEESRLKSLAAKLGVDKNVAFAGWVEDLGSYYRGANAFLQTSKFEGYGLSLVEAALSKLPIVTTKVGIAEELRDGEEAYVCEPRAEAFAFAMSELIEHNEKRSRVGEAGRDAIQRKLISKDEYLRRLLEAWQRTALKIPE